MADTPSSDPKVSLLLLWSWVIGFAPFEGVHMHTYADNDWVQPPLKEFVGLTALLHQQPAALH